MILLRGAMTNKVTVDDKNIATVDITIESNKVEDIYKRTLKAYAEHVNIPGFRKGKAPFNIVEKQIGKERLEAEVVDRLFPDEFQKAVDDNKLNIAFRPMIENVNFKSGEDLTITAKVELKPEVVLPQYKGLTVEYKEFKNSENALEEELEQTQRRFSTLEKKETEANDKDTVVIDFEGFVGEEKIEQGDAKNYTLDLAHSNFIPGFAEQIVGHKAGEEFTIDVEFPKEYHEDKLKGAKAQFKIKLNEVKERKMPEIDDELAKKAGKKNVDDLKEDIQKYLETTANNQNNRLKSDAVFEKIYEETKIDIQETMLSREIEAIEGEAKVQAQRQGVDYQKIVEERGKEELDKEFREEAQRRIKNSLIVEKISNLEDIRIENKDTMDYINRMSMMYGMNPNQFFEEMRKNPAIYASMTQQIIAVKVNDFLLQNNEFKAK
ncbi:trigger factor [bacterium]|nr:trigger factor [bacterium]